MLKRQVKQLLKILRQVRRRREVKATRPLIRKEQIIADLRALSLVAGDAIVVHSSLKSLGYVEGGPRTVLDALYETVTPAGTLIIPTYYMLGSMYQTCLAADRYVFDVRRSGTALGSIPAAFLKFPGIERSIHPTHSVSAVGQQAKYVTEAHHRAPSTFGPDSPWDRLLKLDGKVVGLGVSLAPALTLAHYLEDATLKEFPLPVRMQSTYRLKCRTWGGDVIDVPVTPLDPQYARQRIDRLQRQDLRAYFWQEYEQAGLLTSGQVGQATAWYIPARAMYDHLIKLMHEGITIYSTTEELRRRPLAE